jgi:hypothetical protein
MASGAVCVENLFTCSNITGESRGNSSSGDGSGDGSSLSNLRGITESGAECRENVSSNPRQSVRLHFTVTNLSKVYLLSNGEGGGRCSNRGKDCDLHVDKY